MCDVIGAVVGAVAVAGSVASYSAQNSAAKKQSNYNKAVEEQQTEYRLDLMEYQNQVWEQDIRYAADMLGWAQTEWDRGVRSDKMAREAIEKNTLAGVSAVLIRQVEEDMATVLQGTEIRRQGATAAARLANADRGVEGNSVEAVLQDVARQEGEAMTALAMNRSVSRRQLNRQAIALDAQGDQQLMALQLRTFNPQANIRTPQPISPVAPAAPVAGGNVGQLITGVVGGVTSGMTFGAQANGQNLGQYLRI